MIGRAAVLFLSMIAGGASYAALAGSQVPAGSWTSNGTTGCEALSGARVGGATITKAAMVESGASLPPFADKTTFAFCKVEAVASPVTGSSIRLQMWLPTRWNGKFVGVGGGGFDGGYVTAPLGLRSKVAAGYAAVATDAGHVAAQDPSWAISNSVKVLDYGERANHVGAVFGKALAARFYGSAPKRAYFEGCSNGGRDALMLAQRHPEDYDAIVAGAPAYDFTGVMSGFMRTTQVLGASGVDLTPAKLTLVHQAAVNQCDAADGVKDGLITQPSKCRIDLAALQCKAGKDGACLSPADVGAIKSVYRGAVGRSGVKVMSGYPVGSEYNWAEWLSPTKGIGAALGRQFYAYFVHGDPAWKPASFDLDREDAIATARLGPVIDATNPDLRPFLRRGGKLLMYQGWDDAAIPAESTIRYYASMRGVTGSLGARQTRLFMMPGVAHCTGGNGPSSVDYLGLLDGWVEGGAAPARIVAIKPKSVYRAMAALPTETLMTRPVCAWPKVARYSGSGSREDPASYTCS